MPKYLGARRMLNFLRRAVGAVAPAAPTQLERLGPMAYAFKGQPYVEGAAAGGTSVTTMDYAFKGQPFVRGIA